MSLGPIPSGRLKTLKDVDKWSSLSLCLSVRGMSVILGLYFGSDPMKIDCFMSDFWYQPESLKFM